MICFPYAGGHAGIFKSWAAELEPLVDVYGIQLPGRGHGRKEPPAEHVPELVADLGAALAPSLDKPFVLFGHSLGALLAFEVARWLQRHRRLVPRHLFVSGRRAPQIAWSEPPKWNLSDYEFIQHVSGLNGTPPEILENPELLHLVLPTLRADFKLNDTYEYTPSPPLTCPLTAFGGVDDEESDDERLQGWRSHTVARFSTQLFPGNHFFIHSCERELLASLRHALEDDRARLRDGLARGASGSPT
jgi:medium-chain acyl-[acyl-carrier-protein] hydrolase